MNLILRMMKVFISSFFKNRLKGIFAVSKLHFRVWPNDLDTNFHMNNGRYLTIMDLGRFDLVLRNGLMRFMFAHKSVPVLAAATIRYRLSLDPLQRYRLESRVVCWDAKWIYMEQRFILVGGEKDGAVAAIALVKGGFFNKKQKKMVSVAEVINEVGHGEDSPVFPEHVKTWAAAENALRDVTAEEKA
ncbi:MAG: Mesenchymal stem cell protein DSCD75 [Alphaproteobacteria bacterium]|nr:Mesenchymal stem cell protein DSCD75 [Alphaproteobacteria bacterium]